METLSAHKIYWAILTTRNGNWKAYFSTNKEKAIQMALKTAKKGQRIYVINDRQFGNAKNYFGAKNWIKSDLKTINRSIQTVFPITKKQLNNPIIKE
jgi:lauroyl/myristoyl acyltransferase